MPTCRKGCGENDNPRLAESVDRGRKRYIPFIGKPGALREMKSRVAIVASALVLAGFAGMMSGCEDAAKKSVRVQPATSSSKQAAGNTATSATAAASAKGVQSKADLPPLPLHAAGIRPAPILTYPLRDAKGELIAQVGQKFASRTTRPATWKPRARISMTRLMHCWRAGTTSTTIRSLANCSTGSSIPFTPTNCRRSARETDSRKRRRCPRRLTKWRK